MTVAATVIIYRYRDVYDISIGSGNGGKNRGRLFNSLVRGGVEGKLE